MLKNADITWNDLRKHGINYDYIITLKKKEDGSLEKVYHSISCLDSLFSSLETMLSSNLYDIIDMEKAIIRNVDVNKAIKVCIPYEYNATFINGGYMEKSNPITYSCINLEKTQKNLELKRNNILSKYKQRLKRNNRELAKYEIEAQASDLAGDEYLAFMHKEKIEFLRKRMGYLHAYAYKLTFNQIHDSISFISSEELGWPNKKDRGNPTWIHKVNDDIQVSLWSNFCFGKSSAFYIRIFYKGIQLCPYSAFVTYRYAQATDIINYTRKYELKRAAWEDAANFVMEFCNKAIADPERFVKEQITYEVHYLIQELTQIVASKETYLKNKFKTCSNGSPRYSHVANLISFNEYQLTSYEQNPDEYELLFRMEKISGALKFVDSLNKFSSILSFVRRAIVKIEDLNIQIYPELRKRIPPIQEEVAAIKDKLAELENEFDKIDKIVERHYQKLKYRTDKYKDQENKDKEKDNYYKRHPELGNLEKKIIDLKSEITPMRRLYEQRNKFLEDLRKCKTTIESYGIIE